MALRSGLQTALLRNGVNGNSFGKLLSKQWKGAFGTTTSSTTIMNSNNRSYCSPSLFFNNYKNKTIASTGQQVSLFSTTTPKVEETDDFVNGKPTLKYVTSHLPRSISMMKHEEIIQLSAEGNEEAIIEVLVREIMVVDQIEYDLAYKKFEEIKETNNSRFGLVVLPNQIGLAFAGFASIISTIMVFHFPSVDWFNKHYVTMEVPPPSDLDTALEVGAWSWNWMEPILGQASFVLLCMQLGRSQMQNMGLKPYSSFMKDRQATALADAYPQYNSELVKQYSQSASFY